MRAAPRLRGNDPPSVLTSIQGIARVVLGAQGGGKQAVRAQATDPAPLDEYRLELFRTCINVPLPEVLGAQPVQLATYSDCS
jgi:hypothetical protein